MIVSIAVDKEGLLKIFLFLNVSLLFEQIKKETQTLLITMQFCLVSFNRFMHEKFDSTCSTRSFHGSVFPQVRKRYSCIARDTP